MKNFIVNVREVWIQPTQVEAESPEKAMQLIREGEGTQLENMLEYSHTLDSDSWTVEEVKDDG